MAKSSFTRFFVDRDIFGRPITVLYKGSDKYKTKIGAVCTLVVIVLLLIDTTILVNGYIT